MKRLLSIFVAILLIGGIAFAATPGFRSDPGTGDILGQGKLPSDAHKIFRLVRYVGTSSTLAADSIVTWDLTEDDGVTITTTSISCDSAVAGIIVQQALTQETDGNTAVQDIGKRNWTWLQTYGKSQIDLATTGFGTSVAGDAIGTSTTAGAGINVVPSSTTARQQGIAGFLYDNSVAGATDQECFLRLD